MDARRSCIKVSASDTMRCINSLQLGMSLISPATMPQDQPDIEFTRRQRDPE